MRRLSIFVFIILLVGCTTQPINPPQPTATSLPSTMSEAQQTLIKFFALLNAKNYVEALPLFGGTYEGMQDNNPDVAPSDYVKLWQRACEQNGLQCLLVRSATFKELRGDTYMFQVEFNNPDGSLFVLGPCCGATETDMPPVSQFEYSVTRTADGKFVVLNPPPYVP